MTVAIIQTKTSPAAALLEDKTVQKWLDGVEESNATAEGTTIILPGTSDPVCDDESAPPAIPPKSPLRKSRKVANEGESDPIPQDIVARTQGRVKRFTAALEEKPNLHLRLYECSKGLEEDEQHGKNGEPCEATQYASK